MSASTTESPPHPRPWEEKNLGIAAVLAYLIPGAGHFYQGRMLKGAIYFTGILGLFLWGQKLGEGMVLYNLAEKSSTVPVTLSYAAQLGVGALALPPFLQNRRADPAQNQRLRRLSAPLTAEFKGHVVPSENPKKGLLVGMIRLEPKEGQFGPEIQGTFEGTLDGQPVKLDLGGQIELDQPVKAGFRRKLECSVIDTNLDANPIPRSIEGTIPRSFVNAYGSPPDPDQLQELNGRLGKVYELALVFTWIAGLLNVLAISDCMFGPAYGFGDEVSSQKDQKESGQPATASTAPEATAAAPAASAATNPEPPRADGRPAQKSPV